MTKHPASSNRNGIFSLIIYIQPRAKLNTVSYFQYTEKMTPNSIQRNLICKVLLPQTAVFSHYSKTRYWTVKLF